MKENAIIIDGVTHIPVYGKGAHCGHCSLYEKCIVLGNAIECGICQLFNDEIEHFEILKQE